MSKKITKNCKDCKSCFILDEKDCCKHFAKKEPGKITYLETKILRSEKCYCGQNARFFSAKQKIKDEKNAENNIIIG